MTPRRAAGDRELLQAGGLYASLFRLHGTTVAASAPEALVGIVEPADRA